MEIREIIQGTCKLTPKGIPRWKRLPEKAPLQPHRLKPVPPFTNSLTALGGTGFSL